MESKRNALAELAEEMKEGLDCLVCVPHLVKVYGTAQRIIAELAKVQDEENALYSMENITAEEARNIIRQREGNCILKCRAIAE